MRLIATGVAQSTTVHDGLLHPHLRHCSSPASAVRRLPPAVLTATPAFHVRSSGLFCSRLPDYLRDPSRSIVLDLTYHFRPKTFSTDPSHCRLILRTDSTDSYTTIFLYPYSFFLFQFFVLLIFFFYAVWPSLASERTSM